MYSVVMIYFDHGQRKTGLYIWAYDKCYIKLLLCINTINMHILIHINTIMYIIIRIRST